APEQSLVLLKATGAVPHGGGKRLEVGSQAYLLLRDYIAQGLIPPSADDPHVERLEVTPDALLLRPAQRAALHVRAYWSDGTNRDVTPWALYDVREKQRLDVSPLGVV